MKTANQTEGGWFPISTMFQVYHVVDGSFLEAVVQVVVVRTILIPASTPFGSNFGPIAA